MHANKKLLDEKAKAIKADVEEWAKTNLNLPAGRRVKVTVKVTVERVSTAVVQTTLRTRIKERITELELADWATILAVKKLPYQLSEVVKHYQVHDNSPLKLSELAKLFPTVKVELQRTIFNEMMGKNQPYRFGQDRAGRYQFYKPKLQEE